MNKMDDDSPDLNPPGNGDESGAPHEGTQEAAERADWQNQVNLEGDVADKIADADLEPTLGYGLDKPTHSGDKKWVWILVAIAALAVAGWWWWSNRDRLPASAESTPATTTQPRSTGPSAQPLELPELSASDEFVRGLVAQVAAHPALTRWLANDSLVRRFVGGVEVVAEGGVPRDNLPFLAPEAGFEADASGTDLWRASSASHQRFDDLLAVMQLVDPADAARIVGTITPLADEARRDLGYPEGNSRTAIDKAVAHLVRVSPQLAAEPLVREGETYRYQDATIEQGLSPAQKALLRLGPEQAAWVQAWLHRFHDALAAS